MLIAQFSATLVKAPEVSQGFVKKTGKSWKIAKLSLLSVDENAEYFCISLWNKAITQEILDLKAGDVVTGEGKIEIKAWNAGGKGAPKTALYIVPSKPLTIMKVERKNDAV